MNFQYAYFTHFGGIEKAKIEVSFNFSKLTFKMTSKSMF